MNYYDKIYEGMLPEKEIKGHRGYYPVCNKAEWENLPAVYKAMDWEPVKDPFDKGKLKGVKAVIFDVTYMEPYAISAKVSVHPQEIQKILFCLFKKNECHLYSIAEVELEGGTRLGAHWLQDSVSGAFGIVLNGGGTTVARQGGYQGYIPGRIKKTENGKFEYDSYYRGGDGKASHFEYSNPFRDERDELAFQLGVRSEESGVKEALSPEAKSDSLKKDVTSKLIEAMVEYGLEFCWSDSEIIDALQECGVEHEDFIKAGAGNFVKDYFDDNKEEKDAGFILTNEDIIKNAKAAALRDGYSQFVLEDKNGDYSFTREGYGKPVTPLMDGEKIVGKVTHFWENGIAKVVYNEVQSLDNVIDNAAKEVKNDNISRCDDEILR